jgi:hypothetical protein
MVQSLTILTISMVDCKCVSENKYVSRKSKKEEGGSMLQSACAWFSRVWPLNEIINIV